MTASHGFELKRNERIEEYGIEARLYVHQATGAELLSLIAPDENKVFGITFRTPPSDSTGIAHILEHSVFCGSKKYPVKEPFVELLKGSLQTFLNAFTYPDKTCYPVASQHLQDFYNLIDIYMDAVLHPRLDRQTFSQEGWHFELETPESDPIYKGVVFNEMKGVYASADNLLAEHSQRILFPTTTYGCDSGGDPRHIPDLTWEQLKDFHERHYHPSNARIYFYGDDDPEARLRIMDDYLRDYTARPVDSEIPIEDEGSRPPLHHVGHYPSGGDEDDGTYLTVNWRLPECRDPVTSLGLYLLDQILTDTPASPLKKALLDSGLGEDVTGTGLEHQIRQPYFSTGLKGIKTGNEYRVVDLIETTLGDLVENGIDPKTIEATLNSEEFNFRELNTGNFPRGLSLMITALQTWLYGSDPLEPIRFKKPLENIRSRLVHGEKFFETLISSYLLNNPNRSVLEFRPDPELNERMEREEAEKLKELKASWSPEEIDRVIRETAELKARQARPDRPEDLATIPSLSRSDLPRENRALPIDTSEIHDVPVLFHGLETQGITYLDLGFDLSPVPDDLLGLVPVWARALLETGTEHEDYVQLTQRIGRDTGGIEPEFFTSTRAGSAETAAWAFLRGKALLSRTGDLCGILREITESPRLDNRDRIRQLITEEKAEVEASLIPAGHRFVSLRVRSAFNMADWIQEQLSGISYLETLRTLERQLADDWSTLKNRLHALHRMLTLRPNMLVNITADVRSHRTVMKAAGELIAAFDDRDTESAVRTRFGAGPEEGTVGFAIPSAVNYIAKGFNLHQTGGPVDGTALVASRYLRSGWLWDRVRVQGGAYGGFCGIDHRSGQFTMASYRDPNAAKTLAVYDETPDYLARLEIDGAEIDRAIIGTIGDLDAHLLPDAKGYASLCRHLTGDTDERRQRMRDEVLATKLADLQEFGDRLVPLIREGRTVMMGSGEKLREVPGVKIVKLL